MIKRRIVFFKTKSFFKRVIYLGMHLDIDLGIHLDIDLGIGLGMLLGIGRLGIGHRNRLQIRSWSIEFVRLRWQRRCCRYCQNHRIVEQR